MEVLYYKTHRRNYICIIRNKKRLKSNVIKSIKKLFVTKFPTFWSFTENYEHASTSLNVWKWRRRKNNLFQFSTCLIETKTLKKMTSKCCFYVFGFWRWANSHLITAKVQDSNPNLTKAMLSKTKSWPIYIG